MIRAIVALGLVSTAVGVDIDYSKARQNVGDFYPPAPNTKETTHLSHLHLKHGEKLPPPTDEKLLAAIAIAEEKTAQHFVQKEAAEASLLIEVEQRSGGKVATRSRKLLQEEGSMGLKPYKVPHNW